MIKSQKKKDINVLKNKIKFMSKVAKMQKVLREENENIIKIKVRLTSPSTAINSPRDSSLKAKRPLRPSSM
jgi:hypothetical protein